MGRASPRWIGAEGPVLPCSQVAGEARDAPTRLPSDRDRASWPEFSLGPFGAAVGGSEFSRGLVAEQVGCGRPWAHGGARRPLSPRALADLDVRPARER